MTDEVEFITIDEFVKGMLRYKSRISYYDHIDDEGWPQRVFVGKPMLVKSECEAYVRKLLADRTAKPFVKSTADQGVRAKQPGKRRHPGRPAKVLRAQEGGA